MKMSEIKEGDILIADAGFACLSTGIAVRVEKEGGGLFVTCYNGKHHLDSQVNDDGDVIGFVKE